MDPEAIEESWEKNLQTPEGRSTCLYALALTMSLLLRKAQEGKVLPSEAGPMVAYVTDLYESLEETGQDLTLLEDLLPQVKAIPQVSPTMWDFL